MSLNPLGYLPPARTVPSPPPAAPTGAISLDAISNPNIRIIDRDQPAAHPPPRPASLSDDRRAAATPYPAACSSLRNSTGMIANLGTTSSPVLNANHCSVAAQTQNQAGASVRASL